MGFGLLLCAYFLFTFMSVAISDYCFATFIIGAMVAAKAIKGLKDYNPRFNWLYPFAIIYFFCGIYHVIPILNNLFWLHIPLGGEQSIDRSIINAIECMCSFGFSIIALWASGEIAASVMLEKHYQKSKRNMFWVSVCFTMQLCFVVLGSIQSFRDFEEGKVLYLLESLVFLMCLVVYLLNSMFFYSCFSAICPKGEEFGKPSKPSRFKFMNELNRKLDEKNEQARLEYEKNLQKQNQKYSAKNNNRHHKKKK